MIGVAYCPEPWSLIIPGLSVGGHDYQPADSRWPLDAIVADEFDLVVSLYRRDGHGPAPGVLHIEHLVPDSYLSPAALADIRTLADWAAEHVRAGRKVLCRCQAGINRSSLVAAFTLLRLGYLPGEAIELIRARRSPQALFNGHFRDYIAAEADRMAVSVR